MADSLLTRVQLDYRQLGSILQLSDWKALTSDDTLSPPIPLLAGDLTQVTLIVNFFTISSNRQPNLALYRKENGIRFFSLPSRHGPSIPNYLSRVLAVPGNELALQQALALQVGQSLKIIS